MKTKHDREVRLNHNQSIVLLTIVGWDRFREQCITYSELMTLTGLSKATLYGVLRRLRAEGLVTWEPRTKGTIRALVEVAA